MCSILTFALLLAITTTLSLASASPVSKRKSRNVWIGGEIPACKCHALPKEVSDYCGHSTTILPNARGHTTIDQALGEFDDFTQLLTDSPCSDHLGPLLCFHYFPFWECTPDTAVECEERVLPCNDTCIAAKTDHDASCTVLVNSSPVSGWANHLDCDKNKSFPTYIPEAMRNENYTQKVCANTSVTIKKNFRVLTTKVVPPASSTPKPKVTRPTKAPTTEAPPSSTTPKPKVTSPTETPTTKAPCKCLKCNIRNSANANSFTRNIYTYAIRATITEQTDCNTYQMTVHESFDVHTCNGPVRQASITIETGTATLHTNGHCSNLMAKMNTPVLIAGTHVETVGNGYELHLGCTKQSGLIADWISKFIKKLIDWIAKRTCPPPSPKF